VDGLIVPQTEARAYALAIDRAEDYENLIAGIDGVYLNASPQILAQRIAEALTLAELAAALGVGEDYRGAETIEMNTSRWKVPSLFSRAASWLLGKIERAAAVPVEYEFADKPVKRAPMVAAAAQLDTASRLRAKAEQAQRAEQPIKEAKSELHAIMRELGVDPTPVVSHPIIVEEVQSRFSRTRETILSLDFYRAAYPFWRYSSVLDDRTTTGCRALDGLTMPASDPRWVGFVPPRHWHCRAHVIAVVHSEGVAAKKTAPDEQYAGDGSFGTLVDEWEPKPGSYPKDLWDIYAEAKGIASPHIELEGKWWRKSTSSITDGQP
jgi:SPP1 gp7 family putative phage head morphogenesis protein